jgi:hypothetical protein
MRFLKRRALNFLRVYKKKLIFIASIFLAAKLVVNFHQANSENRLIEHLHAQDIKVVQLLTPKYGSEKWGFEFLGETPFNGCSVKNCFALKSFIKDRPLEKSDAILVHAPDLYEASWKNGYNRNLDQLWLFNSIESPENSLRQFRHPITDLDDLFNLTVTFKPDSDLHIKHMPFDSWKYLQFYTQYMKAYQNEFYTKGTIRDVLVKKKVHQTKPSIVFIANNCRKANRGTVNFINKLIEFVKIDVYGDCEEIKNTLPDPCAITSSNKRKCYSDLLKPYKFYLAIESGQCHHYISDKFWDLYSPDLIFSLNIVPVVRGASKSEYENVTFNKYSFVHANDFNSVESLANYLSYLSVNRSALVEHLNWKLELYDQFETQIRQNAKEATLDSRTRFLAGEQTDMSVYGPFCLACARLNNKKNEIKKSVKISEWFNPKEECWETLK